MLMKTILPLFALCCSPFLGRSQNAIDQLDYNNTNATITNSGQFFHEPGVGAGYEVPKGSGFNAIYAAKFWFMAEDANGQIHASLGGDATTGTDVDQGPYSSNGSYANAVYNLPFMVSICQSEIDQFKLWWACLEDPTTIGCDQVSQPSNETLNSIYNWPAHGDPSLGQSFFLAPFYDRDGNGIYDPILAGDYPIIKGCCATYMIQNDDGVVHTASNTDPIGIEMHYLFYHFGQNDLFYHTTFVDVMAINKGNVNYPKFVHSMYVDGDLGNPGDDFMGTDSLNNMLYFYNADNLDENGYGTNPPALGVAAVNYSLSAAVPYQSGAIFPQIDGLMANGSSWQNPNGNSTKFAYYGNANSSTAWNEGSAGNSAGDRRGILSTSFAQFNAGDTASQSYAIIYSQIGNNLENAEHLSMLAEEAKDFYQNGDMGCDAGGIASVTNVILDDVVVQPNPSNGEFVVSFPTGEIEGVELYTITGQRVDFTKHVMDSALKIEVLDTTSGVYLMVISTDHGILTKRLIIE